MELSSQEECLLAFRTLGQNRMKLKWLYRHLCPIRNLAPLVNNARQSNFKFVKKGGILLCEAHVHFLQQVCFN